MTPEVRIAKRIERISRLVVESLGSLELIAPFAAKCHHAALAQQIASGLSGRPRVYAP